MRAGMRDARLVWDVWRRILTSDALVDEVLAAPREPGRASPELELGAEERAVLAEYASDPIAADITIGMFRRGLTRNALIALRLVPLTHRLLFSGGLDPSSVAADFVQSIGYRDDGPSFWRSAAAFVAYLAELPAFCRAAPRDALALEAAAIALMRRLGQAPPAVWPDGLVRHAVAARASDRHVASPTAVLAHSSCDLTAWLEDPYGFDVEAELEPGEHHWLIQVPNPEAAPEYAELSPRAARAFVELAVPRTATELCGALEGVSLGDALEVIDALVELGAVARVEDEVSP